MAITRLARIGTMSAMLGSVFLGGMAVSSALSANASTTPIVFNACLKAGLLTQVQTTALACHGGAVKVSWSQVGPRGLQGVQGIKGDTGANGQKGDQGVAGVKGDTGAKGVKGDQGVAGVKGDTGASGVTKCASYPRPGIDFSGCNLQGVTMANQNLTGANFSGANLTGANFSAADLAGANFTNANLTNAIFDTSTFDSAILTGSTLTGASFAYVQATGVVNPPSFSAVPVSYSATSLTADFDYFILTVGDGGGTQAGYGLTVSNVTFSSGMLSATTGQTWDATGHVTFQKSPGTSSFTLLAQFTDAFGQVSSATITIHATN